MIQSGTCVIRRLVMPDIEALCRLYAQAPKDFEWVCSEELTSCFLSGEIWGVFEGKCLLCAVPAVPLNARTVLCGSLRPQIPQDVPQKTFVLYPAVGSENIDEKTLLSLLENCTARCLTHRHADSIIAAVPVKSCPGLSPWFGLGLSLIALRPLVRLRPHFLLLSQKKKNAYIDHVTLPMADTRKLGQLLEEGYIGLSQGSYDGIQVIELYR